MGIPNITFVLLLNFPGAMNVLYRPQYDIDVKNFRKSFPLHVHSMREFKVSLNVLYKEQVNNLQSRSEVIHPARYITLTQRVQNAHTCAINRINSWETTLESATHKDFILDLGLSIYQLSTNPDLPSVTSLIHEIYHENAFKDPVGKI